MKVLWWNMPEATQEALQARLKKQLSKAEPIEVVRILCGVANMRANITTLNTDFTSSLVEAVSRNCESLAEHKWSCLWGYVDEFIHFYFTHKCFRLSALRIPRSHIPPNVGALLDSAVPDSVRSGSGLAMHRLSMMNTSFIDLSFPLQTYLRNKIFYEAKNFSTINYARLIRP